MSAKLILYTMSFRDKSSISQPYRRSFYVDDFTFQFSNQSLTS